MSWLYLLPFLASLTSVHSHGRVMDPISRASAWRAGYPTPPNYDDDGLYCGGFSVQWSLNGGKCGICGDAYNLPTPRPHELGGKWGLGIIVAQYQPGSIIPITIQLTTSHQGFWEFKLCPDPHSNEQDCFDKYPLYLSNGNTKYYPTRGSTTYVVEYRLPAGLVCDHCVLQWRYTAGNNWGDCKNGTTGLGCGNQEQFGACSDITIGVSGVSDVSNSIDDVEEAPQGYEDIPYPLFFYLTHGYYDKGEIDLVDDNNLEFGYNFEDDK